MKKSFSILALLILISCGSGKEEGDTQKENIENKASEMTGGATDETSTQVDSNYKKYAIKSGIISFESTMQMSGMNIKTKKVLYFDDYGIKECEEEFNEKGELTKRDFVKNGFRYVCSIEYGGGSKSKALGYGVAAVFNIEEAKTLKDNQFKIIENLNICGKSCNGFSMMTPSGTIKMYGWNRITLKTIVENGTTKSETICTKIEENVKIPSEKFEVPKGVKISER